MELSSSRAAKAAAVCRLLLMLSVVVGCGSGGSSSRGSGSDGGTGTNLPPRKPVTPVPDNAHRIGVGTTSGATITATGADGTRYTLTIPANALLARQVIKVTPPTTIGGLPLSGGLVGAVQLAPDGLVCTRRRR